MNRALDFLKLIRFPNVVMLVVVQLITMNLLHWINYDLTAFLIIFSTVCIAVGGYILNDYYDYEIDKINKKNLRFSKKKLLTTSLVFFLVGLFISILIGEILDNFVVVIYFLVPSVILVIYAKYLSRIKIIGNILVALLSAYAISIIFHLGLNFELITTNFIIATFLIIYSYASIAFSLTWAREIVKDCEDVKGDKSALRITIPLEYGIFAAKCFTTIFVTLSLLLFSFFTFQKYSFNTINYATIALLGTLIFFPIVLVTLWKSKEKEAFKKTSLLLKILMFLGMLSFPLLFK